MSRSSFRRAAPRSAAPSPESHPSEASDARRFLAGDPAATRFVRRRVRTILGRRAAGLPASEREDLEQEILVQLWEAANRPGFDLDRPLRGFVDTVAGRRLVDHWRTRRDEQELATEPASGDGGALTHLLSSERRRLVARAVALLGGSCRELIGQIVQDRRSYAEIARRTGRSAGALRVQMHRCVRRVRELVEELEHGATGGGGAR